ncbi:MAG TPA: L-rhamnose mutarotase [Verrucomicrobiae bacterium]
MMRKAFVMTVNAGAEEEYERRHRPIWPELEKTLLEHGVRNYSIFLHAETRQLFAYVEFESEGQWEAISGTGVCQRWWKYMRELMPANADGSPVAVELREVFHIERPDPR